MSILRNFLTIILGLSSPLCWPLATTSLSVAIQGLAGDPETSSRIFDWVTIFVPAALVGALVGGLVTWLAKPHAARGWLMYFAGSMVITGLIGEFTGFGAVGWISNTFHSPDGLVFFAATLLPVLYTLKYKLH